MHCKLCLQEKKLCSKSHIIPDFMYKELFDEKHRIIKFTPLVAHSDSDVPTGEYESNILCENCDNTIIGAYESYAKMALYGGNISAKMENFRKDDGLEFTQVSGLDYKKFKLFLLSVLWKASISGRNFFANVQLGSYEEKLRRMILSEDPGSHTEFPCILTSYRKHNIPKEIIMSPKRIHLDQKIGYHFLINGVQYIYKISENESVDWVLEASINEKGEMKVIHVPEERAKQMMNKFLGVNMFPEVVK